MQVSQNAHTHLSPMLAEIQDLPNSVPLPYDYISHVTANAHMLQLMLTYQRQITGFS